MRYQPYESTLDVPNIVVDGSPNAATVLTLTHWPGVVQPAGLGADLSAQMAFRFVDSGTPAPAEIVTNNHFDQDGLVSIFALIEPDVAQEYRDLLIDVAAAGDFATYRHRAAARVSMAISRLADPTSSPIAAHLAGSYEQQCGVLYPLMLDQLVAMLTESERFSELWSDEDADLTASEQAVRSGRITIDERLDIDLAIVDVAAETDFVGGHRFAGGDRYAGAHPMAINNATRCLRLLQVHGHRYAYTDRYESWVQMQTRRPLPRVDLRPLADELSSIDSASTWSASAPSTLSPQLESDAESSLDRSAVIETISRHLATSPPAWDPYAS